MLSFVLGAPLLGCDNIEQRDSIFSPPRDIDLQRSGAEPFGAVIMGVRASGAEAFLGLFRAIDEFWLAWRPRDRGARDLVLAPGACNTPLLRLDACPWHDMSYHLLIGAAGEYELYRLVVRSGREFKAQLYVGAARLLIALEPRAIVYVGDFTIDAATGALADYGRDDGAAAQALERYPKLRAQSFRYAVPANPSRSPGERDPVLRS